MTKHDWPALLPAGMHNLSLDRLELIALDGPLATVRRVELFARLTVFIQALAALDCYAEIWIDGSFTTDNPSPSDVDVAVFLQAEKLDKLSPEQEASMEILFDRSIASERFGIDLYLEWFGDFHRAAYWRGLFGFCHDGATAKGIVVLECAP